MMKDNYAVMRHGVYDRQNHEIIQSIERVVHILKDFLIENNIQSFVIWHSPIACAANTAKLLMEYFQSEESKITILGLESKEFLRCNNKVIQGNLENFPKEFVLMISHEPDIHEYLKLKYKPNVVRNLDFFHEGRNLPYEDYLRRTRTS